MIPSKSISGTDPLLVLAKDLADNVIEPLAHISDEEFKWPEKELREILNAGLGGLIIPTEYGGLGQGLDTMIRICEIFGEKNATVGICLGMHYSASAVLAAQARDYLIENYIRPISAGKHLTTLALSEPGTGAHFYFPMCSAQKQDYDYVLSGTKSFVTNGSKADSYIVSTQHTGGDEDALMSMWLVDGDSPGIEWGPEWKGFGMRGNSSRNMELKNVRVLKEHLLGSVGDQMWFVMNVVTPYFLAAMTGTYLGAATHAYNIALNHLKNRKFSHSGKLMGEDSTVQAKLGQLWVRLESARRHVYWATREYDTAGDQALQAILSTKALVSDVAVDVVNVAMTFCGGTAYRENDELQRLLRDIRACPVMSPTSEFLYKWVGRSLLGQELLSD